MFFAKELVNLVQYGINKPPIVHVTKPFDSPTSAYLDSLRLRSAQAARYKSLSTNQGKLLPKDNSVARASPEEIFLIPHSGTGFAPLFSDTGTGEIGVGGRDSRHWELALA